VNRWVRAWSDASEPELVEVVSPLPVEVARERLKAARISDLRASMSFSLGGGYRVVGRVGQDRIRLQGAKIGGNSWRPILHARLEPAGSGSRLVGVLAMPAFLKAFTALWLGGVSLFFLIFVAHAVTLAITGDASAGTFLICLLPLAMLLAGLGISKVGITVGRDEASYLRSWLAEQLQTPRN
jgi:hypothetical protein